MVSRREISSVKSSPCHPWDRIFSRFHSPRHPAGKRSLPRPELKGTCRTILTVHQIER